MLDLSKVNLSSEDKGRYITFFADLRLHTEQRIDKDSLFRMHDKDKVKQEVCKDLLRAIHYHFYGELYTKLMEYHQLALRTYPNHEGHQLIEDKFNEILALLKKP